MAISSNEKKKACAEIVCLSGAEKVCMWNRGA